MVIFPNMDPSIRQRIKLVCCIGVSKKEHFCRPFMRHFVHHYLGLGVLPECFLITLHAPEHGEDIEYATSYLAQFGIPISGHLIKEYDCFDFYARNFQLMKACPDDEWIILVDFDELIEFPKALPQYVADLDATGCNVVMGTLVDRFAEHYHLAEIQEGPPIWDQFPIQTAFTKEVVQGCHVKTCIFRNYIEVNLGHHAIVGTRGEPIRASHQRLKVHHFKWDATLPPKLLMRRQQFKTEPEKYHWHAEPDRILELVNHGRIEFRK